MDDLTDEQLTEIVSTAQARREAVLSSLRESPEYKRAIREQVERARAAMAASKRQAS